LKILLAVSLPLLFVKLGMPLMPRLKCGDMAKADDRC